MSEKKSLAIVVEEGTVDKLYCAFIMSSAAIAMDMEAYLYFTFFGLMALVKGAMDKAGLPETYKQFEGKMVKNLAKMKYPKPYDMLKQLKKSKNFHLYACSPSMAMFEVKKEDLIPEVEQIVGAATFLELASRSDVSLFI